MDIGDLSVNEEPANSSTSSPLLLPTVDINQTRRVGVDISTMLSTADDVLFTAHQRYVLRMTPWYLHFVLGMVASLIGFFGIVANVIVLLIFTRYRRLRTTANIFVMNLAAGDLLAACLHPMAAYSCFQRGWSFGSLGCTFYGSTVALCGFNSIVTLTLIACERYQVIAHRSVLQTKWNISKKTALRICICIWIYCLALVSPPFFGVSRYQPEGLLVTCSWDYSTRTLSNRIYYLYLVVFGFVLPVTVIVFCYSTVFMRIISHDQEMVTLASNSASQKVRFSKMRRKMDIQTAQIIGTLILLVITAWTPYTIVSFIGQFGSEGDLTPLAASLPAFFAKGACAFDPLVYAFSHPRFRLSMEHYFAQLWYQIESFFVLPAKRRAAAVRNGQRSDHRRVTFSGSTPPSFEREQGHQRDDDSRENDREPLDYQKTLDKRHSIGACSRGQSSTRSSSWPANLNETRFSSLSTPNLSTEL